jgi:hypothetical protein
MDTTLPPKHSAPCQAPNIAIMCMGSQGDCQPFIALALALQAQGARVRFYAPTEMEEICVAFFASSVLPPIDFFGMPHLSVKKILDSDPAVRDAMNRGNFLTFMQGVSQPKYIDMTFSDADLVLGDLLNNFDADHVVYNTFFAAQGATVAEVLKVSSTLVSMQMTGSPSALEPSHLSPTIPQAALFLTKGSVACLLPPDGVFPELSRREVAGQEARPPSTRHLAEDGHLAGQCTRLRSYHRTVATTFASAARLARCGVQARARVLHPERAGAGQGLAAIT